MQVDQEPDSLSSIEQLPGWSEINRALINIFLQNLLLNGYTLRCDEIFYLKHKQVGEVYRNILTEERLSQQIVRRKPPCVCEF